jgi:phosphopantetheinyl transferase
MAMTARVFPDLPEIRRLPILGPAAPVVYAAVEKGEGAREFLADRLLKALAAKAPEWTETLAGVSLKLDTGPLGQPLLKLGERLGPSLSFSEAGSLVWCAMAGRGRVGLDAAREADFVPPYPYARAFSTEEWDWAARLCQGRTASAAALLWTAKEAAVKALGVGFHTLEPLDLAVAKGSPAQEGINLTVRTPEPVSAWARPLADGWLALAGV